MFCEPASAFVRSVSTPVAGARQRYHTDARSWPGELTLLGGSAAIPNGSKRSAVAPTVVPATVPDGPAMVTAAAISSFAGWGAIGTVAVALAASPAGDCS